MKIGQLLIIKKKKMESQKCTLSSYFQFQLWVVLSCLLGRPVQQIFKNKKGSIPNFI